MTASSHQAPDRNLAMELVRVTESPALAAGRSVLHRTQGWIGLDAVTSAGERAVVYDVAVEAPHNFFADDLLVHNKAAPVPGPSDPWAFLFDRPTGPGWSERKWWRSRR